MNGCVPRLPATIRRHVCATGRRGAGKHHQEGTHIPVMYISKNDLDDDKRKLSRASFAFAADGRSRCGHFIMARGSGAAAAAAATTVQPAASSQWRVISSAKAIKWEAGNSGRVCVYSSSTLLSNKEQQAPEQAQLGASQE